MKTNKKGERNISVKDASLVKHLELQSMLRHKQMFEIAEELMNKGLYTPVIVPETSVPASVSKVIIDKCGYSQFVDALINNGYRVDITPVDGATGLNERLMIKFKKESEG